MSKKYSIATQFGCGPLESFSSRRILETQYFSSHKIEEIKIRKTWSITDIGNLGVGLDLSDRGQGMSGRRVAIAIAIRFSGIARDNGFPVNFIKIAYYPKLKTQVIRY